MDGELDIIFSKELFASLGEDKRKIIAASARFFNFQPGQTLIRKDETGTNVYFIVKGACGVFLQTPAGEELVAKLSPGDFFGEMAIMAEGRRTADVRTLEDVRVASFAANTFKKYFLAEPEILKGLDAYYRKRQSRLNLIQKRLSAQKSGKKTGLIDKLKNMLKRRTLLLTALIFFYGFLYAQDIETLNKIQFANGLFNDGMYEVARRQFLEISSSAYPEIRSEASFMQAECLFQMKNFPLSYEEFNKVYSSESSPQIKKKSLIRMADSSYSMSQWGNAASLYGKYIEIYGETEDALFYLAQCLSMAGKYEESEKYYIKLLAKYPGGRFMPHASYSLGYAFMQTRNYKESLKYFSSVPEGILKAESMFYEGFALLKLEDYDGAVSAFGKIGEKYPASDWSQKAALKKAEVLIIQNKYDEAEKLIMPLEKNKLTGAWANYLAGQILYKKGNFAQAAVYYKRTSDNFPKTEWAEKSMFSFGWCFLNLKDYRKAGQSFAELILKYSKTSYFPRAQLLIGHCYFFEKNYESAQAAYNRLLQAFPMNEFVPEAVFWRGLAAMKTGDFALARKMFERIINKFGNSEFLARSFLNLGITLSNQNKITEAVSVLKEGLKSARCTASEADDINYALGGMYVKLGLYAEAALCYRKITTPEKKPAAQLALGHSFVNAREFDEARKEYLKVSALYPSSDEAVEAAFSAGLSFYKEKKWTEAISNFADFAAKYPGNVWTKKAYYYAGWCAFAKKDWEDAVSLWEKYYEIQPDAEILLHIGDSYYNAGKQSESAAVYRKLLETFPASAKAPQALYSIALAERKTGDFVSARKDLELIKTKYASSEILPDALFLFAEISEEQKSFPEAVKEFAAVFEKYPQSKIAPDALYRAALSALKAKDYESGRSYLRKLTQVFPKSDYTEEAKFRICESYSSEGILEKALSSSISFKEEFPTSFMAPAALEIAVASLKALNRNDKVDDLLRVIEKDYPASEAAAKLYYKKGIEFFENKDYEAAVEELRKVTGILHDKTSALSQKMIAESFLYMKQPEQARLEFLRVIYIYPDFEELVAESQYQIGAVYIMQSKGKEAAESFNNVAVKWPSSLWAEKARLELQKLK